MLDDLKIIHERDSFDALGIVEKQWQQLGQKFQIPASFAPKKIRDVVYAGMGGSALAASFAHTWPTLNVSYEIVRDYELPRYVGPHSLVIIASYSGNTEETISALADARAKNAQIIVISGGGELQRIAEAEGLPWVQLPKAAQPRYAAFYNFKALIDILEHAGLINTDQSDTGLQAAADFIKKAVVTWRADVSTLQNPAKKLALELIGKSAVIYSGPKMFPAAYKWKISFNENAKQVAWTGQYPEFNHNEFIGWSKQPVDKPYSVIDLRSSFEHERVRRRFEVSARLLSGMRPEPYVVEAQGDTPLKQMLWLAVFGDFVTIYVALLNGLNPAPVDLVEKFKKELG